jgi:hypothetical protein
VLGAKLEDGPVSRPTVSRVTTALPGREPFLRRLVQQAPWVRADEWIICGPRGLGPFAREMGAIYIECAGTMGECRNLCAEAAKGEIIIQIDDDDWQHCTRMARQIEALLGRHDQHGSIGPEVVGSSWLYCLHAPTRTASRISYWDSLHCLPGATLAYWRSAWRRHPFEAVQAEDGPFTSYFGSQGTCFDMHDPKLLVYMRHGAHKPEQRDWWRETRNQERRLSALEIMRRRIAHPGRKIELVEAATPHDIALAHEEEAATVYVRWLMGDDFDRFCESVEPVREVVHE